MTSNEICCWRDAYRAELMAMDALSREGGRRSKQWNRRVDAMQRAHLKLRETHLGRDAITEMINDEVPTVALWSASHALFWAADDARAHLESVAAGDGLASFDAKMTLREFDAGRLRMDWQPGTR